MTNHRVLIMVIAWNNAEDVEECVESLLVQTTVPTILIIDNDSSPKISKRLHTFATERHVKYLNTAHNGGTAGGFNAGITYARDHEFNLVGTLNADAIADKKWLESLIVALNTTNQYGIATGILARRDGKTLDTTGDFFTTWGIPGPRLRGASINDAPKEQQDVFGSTGGAFLARTSMFDDIGLFDETFFMYFEDVDISFRAQLRGWKVRYTPEAIAYHKLGASSSTVPGLAIYNTFKNLPLLFVKNVPGKLWWSYYPRFTLAHHLIFWHAVARGYGKYAFKGWFACLTLIPHMLRERRIIQRNRTATPDYIDGIILHDIPPEQTGLRKFRNFFTGR